MKYSFIVILWFVVLCTVWEKAIAQSPCVDKFLTTSTTASVNYEKLPQKNFDPTRPHPMIFNWTMEYFPMHSNAPDIRYQATIQSPFFQRTNVMMNHLSNKPDMESANGWELIRQDFGYVYQPYLPTIQQELNELIALVIRRL